MRLGVLLHDYSPGGTERMALRLAGEWARQGRQVMVICGNPEGFLKPDVPSGVTVIYPFDPMPRGWRSRQQLGRFAGAVCRERGLDALFVPGNFHFACIPAIRRHSQPELKLIAKLSNPVRRAGRGSLANWLAGQRAVSNLRFADAVVAMSQALAKEAEEGLGKLPFKVIDEPILDDETSTDHSAELRRGVIGAGRFVPQKDFELAIRAMAHLSVHNVALTLLGDGPSVERVSKLAAQFGIEKRVSFPGRVSDAGAWFRQAQVFLLSSLYEGYPAVLIEALAAGTRLVTTDCSPAIREIVTSCEIGEVVASRNAKELAAAIDRQLALGPVPQRLICELYRRFSRTRSAQRYLELFDSL